MCRSQYSLVSIRNVCFNLQMHPHFPLMRCYSNCDHLWAWSKCAERRWRGDVSHWVLQTDTTCQTLNLAARLTLIPALTLLPQSSHLALKTTSDKHFIYTLNIAIIKSPPITWSLFIPPFHTSSGQQRSTFSLHSPPSFSPRDVNIPV